MMRLSPCSKAADAHHSMCQARMLTRAVTSCCMSESTLISLDATHSLSGCRVPAFSSCSVSSLQCVVFANHMSPGFMAMADALSAAVSH